MPKKEARSTISLLLSSLAQTGCFVRERRAPPCRGGVLVEGHYGPCGHGPRAFGALVNAILSKSNRRVAANLRSTTRWSR